jgi:hypothetical protein
MENNRMILLHSLIIGVLLYLFMFSILEQKQIVYENGRMMLLHSLIIGVLLYLFMFFILGQKQHVAENRSILLAALILIYMILSGHGGNYHYWILMKYINTK